MQKDPIRIFHPNWIGDRPYQGPQLRTFDFQCALRFSFFGDVTKTPETDLLIIQGKRAGESLENSSILELHDVLMGLTGLIEASHVPHEALGIGHLVKHVFQQTLILSCGEQFIRYTPQFTKAAVGVQHRTASTND